MNSPQKYHDKSAQFTIIGSDDITESIFSNFMRCKAVGELMYPLVGENQNGDDFFALTPDEFEEQFSPCLSDFSQLSERQKRNYDNVYNYTSTTSKGLLVSRISDRKISLGLHFKLEIEKPKNFYFHSLLTSAIELFNPVTIKCGISSKERRNNFDYCEAGYIEVKDYGKAPIGLDWFTYFSEKLIKTVGKEKFKLAKEEGYLITDFKRGLLLDLSSSPEKEEVLYDANFFEKTKKLIEILKLKGITVNPY